MNALKTNNQIMQQALSLAKKGIYHTRPNPMVGCVIADENNVIIAKGYHQQHGRNHAETNALVELKQVLKNNISYKIKKLKLFVTLEPCTHHGKTPPCVDIIIDSGIKTVIIAMTDPNPLVTGKGIKKLQDSGINVTIGIAKEEAEALNQPFIKAMKTGIPYVSAKIAMSLDGKTAMANGQSKWITGKASRLDVQYLRMRCDAILTGSGTVLADNPKLTVRLSECHNPPIRLILDTKNQLKDQDIALKIFSNDAPTKHYHKDNTALNKNGRIDLLPLLRQLHKEGINHVLLEAGTNLVGAMLEEKLIDEFIIYSAPLIMGNDAQSAFKITLNKLDQAIPLKINTIEMIETDIKIQAAPIYK